jgi:hypothetical protein
MTLQEILTPRLGQALRPNIWDAAALVLVIGALARRMGGAKRYPSIASYGDDGFRRLNPSYVLQ